MSTLSYRESLLRWSTPEAAQGYPSEYSHSWRARRELRCIEQFAETLRPGSRVLDLPCGTGRLSSILDRHGLHVVGADCSPWMAGAAAHNWETRMRSRPSVIPAPTFEVRQAVDTGYPDQSFDAVVCNRLLHHFREPEARTAVLREFGRICRGPILVSFFNAFSIDAVRFRLKHWLRGTTPGDRIPIPRSRLEVEAAAAGLEVVSRHAVVWGVSPLWYLVVRNRSQPAARAA